MTPFDDTSGTETMQSTVGRIVRIGVVGATLAFGVITAAYTFGIRLNISGSIPPGLYRLFPTPIHRGSIVIVCLPPETAALARARDYIPAGSCDDGNAPVGKFVAAMAGDTVDVTPGGLEVNGKILANTRPLENDQHRRPLTRMAAGRYAVELGEIWLISTYSSRSFDSRYFGPLSMTRVVSRVLPVFTIH